MIETMLQDPNTTEETRDYIEEILKTIRDQSEPKPKWFAYLDLAIIKLIIHNIDGSLSQENFCELMMKDDFAGCKDMIKLIQEVDHYSW